MLKPENTFIFPVQNSREKNTVKIKGINAGEMTPLVKYLPYKYEALSSNT